MVRKIWVLGCGSFVRLFAAAGMVTSSHSPLYFVRSCIRGKVETPRPGQGGVTGFIAHNQIQSTTHLRVDIHGTSSEARTNVSGQRAMPNSKLPWVYKKERLGEEGFP